MGAVQDAAGTANHHDAKKGKVVQYKLVAFQKIGLNILGPKGQSQR